MLMTLVMHRVVKDAPVDWTDISSSMLTGMLDLLCEKKVSTTAVSSWQGDRAVCLSFDDGSISDYSIVYPELIARGLNATFFIVPEWVGKPGYLHWTKIREMHEAGMEIGSHSLNHLHMSCLSKEQVWQEFDGSKKNIEDQLGAPVSTFAYPFGDHASWCNELGLQAGYKRLCSSRPGLGATTDTILPRVSVNRRHTQADLPQLIQPSVIYLQWLNAFDKSRTIARKIIGKKVYLRIRSALFR